MSPAITPAGGSTSHALHNALPGDPAGTDTMWQCFIYRVIVSQDVTDATANQTLTTAREDETVLCSTRSAVRR